MAHSYIEAFETEDAAFTAFAEDFPDRTTFLVDTYDTLTGVDSAIEVIHRLGLSRGLGVRLDSGDLVALARQTRQRLDAAGLEHVRIFVSGGLDELDLERFRAAGVPIDAAGVGTRMGVAADAPSLDSAYKLVAFDGRPVLKLSSGKATYPGPKQVWRNLPMGADVLATRDEPAVSGAEPLLTPVMLGGTRLGPPDTIEAARGRLDRELDALPLSARDLHHPEVPEVVISERLHHLTERVTAGLARERSGGPVAPAERGT